MNKKSLILILLLGFILMACSTSPPTKNVTLIAEDILWQATLIEAQIGQEIQLTLRNDGVLDHSFEIAELNIDVLLTPGKSETLSFVISEAGTLDFICNIPGHEEVGMIGEIVISD